MNTTADNTNSDWVDESSSDDDAANTRGQAPEPTGASDTTTQPPSQLFTVRIWPESTVQGVITWRGKVQAVPNGAWRYFQDWQVLGTFLQSQVEALATAPQESNTTQPNP